ncbi:MAG: 30S ribosomal protein S20 [Luteitalea sp.]|nr:30S ribosomal protein S20 [Luteitalea sp.]
MANHASALKAHRQNLKRRERNRVHRSRLRTSLKAVHKALAAGKVDEVTQNMSATTSIVDKMASKGIIHANAAARYKSRLVKRLSALPTVTT